MSTTGQERCVWCGERLPAAAAYCPSCGHEILDLHRTSLMRLLREHVAELLEQLFNPVFAFLKTVWLVALRPGRLYWSLISGRPTVRELPFPLHFMWLGLFPEARPYVLDPVELLLASVVLGLVLGAGAYLEDAFTEVGAIFTESEFPLFRPLSSEAVNLIADITINLMALYVALALLFMALSTAWWYRKVLGWGRPEAERQVLTQLTYYHSLYSMGLISLAVMLGRVVPGVTGVADNTVWGRLWFQAGTVLALGSVAWTFGVVPWGLFPRHWGYRRTGLAFAVSWLWLLVLYGAWRTVGVWAFVLTFGFWMTVLPFLWSLPPWLSLLCLWPLFGVLLAFSLWRYLRRPRSA